MYPFTWLYKLICLFLTQMKVLFDTGVLVLLGTLDVSECVPLVRALIQHQITDNCFFYSLFYLYIS